MLLEYAFCSERISSKIMIILQVKMPLRKIRVANQDSKHKDTHTLSLSLSVNQASKYIYLYKSVFNPFIIARTCFHECDCKCGVKPYPSHLPIPGSHHESSLLVRSARDLSPPRRRQRHDSPLAEDMGKSEADLSPPRRGKLGTNHDEDLSPPRRQQDDRDISPPRKKDQDLSAQRRKGGLLSAHELKDDIRMQQEEQEAKLSRLVALSEGASQTGVRKKEGKEYMKRIRSVRVKWRDRKSGLRGIA